MPDNITGTLRNWRKQYCTADGRMVIWGHIYDDVHNRFPNGHFIHTSSVKKIEGDIVYTRNSVYKLEGEEDGPPIGYAPQV